MRKVSGPVMSASANSVALIRSPAPWRDPIKFTKPDEDLKPITNQMRALLFRQYLCRTCGRVREFEFGRCKKCRPKLG